VRVTTGSIAALRRAAVEYRAPSLGLLIFCVAIFLALGTAACASGQLSPAPSTAANPAAASPQGFVSINFDDGYESAYVNGVPILDSAGLKSTSFIITQLVGHPGFITKDQLFALQASGHEIGAHTRTHPHLPTLNEDQQRAEILGSFDDLVSLGMRPQLFAYPYGEYDSTSVSAARMAFLGARTVNGTSNDKSADPLLLNCYSIHPGAPVYAIGDITRLIDSAQSNGTWLILLFHKVDETGDAISVPHDLIQQVADYLTARKVRVVTMSEGLQLDLGRSSP
jgi:peptidoglycan/xylan/chitin deacetylase (PgdA/CDA1 family)